MSEAEEQFVWQCRAYELPEPEREYRFHPKRRWRYDFCWVNERIAVEIQGGVWKGKNGEAGKHGQGSGIVKDYEKLNAAQRLGWRVYQFTPGQVKNGEAIQFMNDVFQGVRT